MDSRLQIVCVTINLLALEITGIPLPIDHPSSQTHSTVEFLRRFGYLPAGQNASETLYTEEKIAEAVALMQRFGGLKETGKLDDETINLMSKPRCGVPDIIPHENKRFQRFILGSKGWNKRKLTYRLENVAPQLKYDRALADLENAMELWGKHGKLKFVPARDEVVDIAVSFGRASHGDRFPFDGRGGTLAHAFFPQNTPGLSGDIHFDLEEDWSHDNRGVSFPGVALHELGHSLGLSHSPSQESVMFPYYQVPVGKELRLGRDDIMAMYYLYASKSLPGDDDVEITERPRPTTAPPFTSSTPRTRPTYNTPKTTPEGAMPSTTVKTISKPSLCDGEYDSVAFFRNELFVFSGKFMWRFVDRGILAGGSYPALITRLFPFLDGVGNIDAAFDRENGDVMFISGEHYWTLNERNLGRRSLLADFDLPSPIDTAFIWGKNGATYFFKEDNYWKYNSTTNKMQTGYPMKIPDRWQGIPSNIKSVITFRNDKTYFFKNTQFWEFDDKTFKAEEGFPKNAMKFWFNC